jgi:hypothetical protein
MRRLAALAALVLAAGCGSANDAKPPSSWALGTTPTLPGTALFAGVSCASRSFCVAVGSRLRHLVSHTLVERWNGSTWQVVPTGDPADRRSNLTAVSCVSESFCAAVGSHFTDRGSRGLIELWNGHAWRVAPTTGSTAPDALAGVSCTSPTFCVAVGTRRGPVSHLLVRTWRGRQWAVTPVELSADSTSLSSVTCVEGPVCVAVGQRSAHDVVSTLAASFDGGRWALEPSPNVSVFSNLTGVACVSRDWCVAVGGHYHGRGTETLVLRREETWSLRPSPSRSFMSSFAAVSCTSESACAAVGSQRAGESNHSLVADWDGTAWTIPPSANPGATDVLVAVSCVHDGKPLCFAVGAAGPTFGVGSKPLVLQGR